MITRDRFAVVGIGASAGGLQALDSLLHTLPNDTGMAFVVVTHLPAGRTSALPGILSRYTKMPVSEANPQVVIKPDHVYVCPPDRVLTIKHRRLHLNRPDPRLRHSPIDGFLSSMAEDCQDAAIGVLLSGGGSDGTLGLRAIKGVGGVTFAQDLRGSDPAQSNMPNTAIAAGVVDLVLPIEDLGQRLAGFARRFRGSGVENAGPGAAEGARTAETVAVISRLLRDRIGHDFSGYKPQTFLRRVRRRMQVLQLDTIDAYIAELHKDSGEATLLFRALLIGVTSFFRDPAAFEALEQKVIPRLFEHKDPNAALRLWVPGCAIGDEAYSIAILLREHMDTTGSAQRVQIFATDIDEAALDIARAGRYPPPALANVSKERLQRFFTHADGQYTISEDIRGMCTFSAHNVLQDPPFSHLDLISCRNLFIYFGAEFQARMLPLYHRALKPGGYLFLGNSEDVSRHADLFSVTDKHHRIYQRREGTVSPPGHRRGQATGAATRGLALPAKGSGEALTVLRSSVERRVLEQFAPAHVVINRDGDVLYYSARTRKYLEAAPGLPSGQLIAMARKELRLALRVALRKALETRKTVESNHLAVEIDGRTQMMDLVIEPFGQKDHEPLFLVVFRDVGQLVEVGESPPEKARTDKATDPIKQELRETRERLRTTAEVYETALEELESSNTDLPSVNEALQSTNEEMATSKEELQSVNEELNTVNAELNDKVDELDRANADLRNVFESTGVAIVFLDRDFLIRSFTPAATRIFTLISGDRGRPLTDLACNLAEAGDLRRDARHVFEQGEPIERRVHHVDNHTHYLMRILPYRKERETIEGTLIVFVNITRLVEYEARQRAILEELNTVASSVLGRIAGLSENAPTSDWTAVQFRNAFVGRLRALTRCYEVLAQTKWDDVPFANILKSAFSAHRLENEQRRIAMDGPAVHVAAPKALALTVVLHELADEAVREGALSNTQGQVSVAWEMLHKKEHGDVLEIEWRETGGPHVTRPRHKSFNRELIERELETTLHGTVNVTYAQAGRRVRLAIPL